MYRLNIIYDGEAPGTTEMHNFTISTGQQLKKFREDVFFAGLFIPDSDVPNEGEIICPYRIRKILVTIVRPE